MPKAKTVIKRKGVEGFGQAFGAIVAGILIYEVGKRFFGYKPRTP